MASNSVVGAPDYATGGPLWRRLARRIWGYDFFVSYHWASGGRYAVSLVESLRERRYDCFLDQTEFAGGDDWEREAEHALRHTKRLIVIGTQDALSASKPVEREVAIFTSRSDRVIPIVFGRRITAEERERMPVTRFFPASTLEIVEQADRRELGPSDQVLAEIEKSHRVLRRRSIRSLLLMLVVIGLTAATLVSFVSWIDSEVARHAEARQKELARAALIDSQRQLAQGLIERGVREVEAGKRVGLNALHQAYRTAQRLGDANNAAIPPDEVMSRSARRMLAGWQSRIGNELRHNEQIHSADFSPDGDKVRTHLENTDGEPVGYLFWDTATGRRLGQPIRVDDEYFTLDMSGDWTRALYRREDGIQHWDIVAGASQELDMRGLLADGQRHSGVLSPDLAWLLKHTGTSLQLVRLAPTPLVHGLHPAFAPAARARFSADSSTLMVMSGDATRVQLFDVQSGRASGAAIEVTEGIASAQLAMDGRHLGVVDNAGNFGLWRTGTSQSITRVQAGGGPTVVRFSPDGSAVLVIAGTAMRILDTRDGHTLGGPQTLESAAFSAVFSSDGNSLATTGSGKPGQGRRRGPARSQVQIWDVKGLVARAEISRDAEPTAPVSFSPDGRALIVGTTAGHQVHDAGTGVLLLRSTGKAHSAPVFAGESAAVYTKKRDGALLTLYRAELPALLAGHPQHTSLAVLSPRADRLATVVQSRRVQVRGLAGGKAPGPAWETPEPIEEAGFSPDGAWLVTRSRSGKVHVWDSVTGEGRGIAADGTHDNEGLLTSDGRLLVTRGEDAGFWDYQAGNLSDVRFRNPVSYGTAQLAVSPDGREWFLADHVSAGVAVEDARTGKTRYVFDAASGTAQNMHDPEHVRSFALAPDAKRLVAASSTGVLRVWETETGSLIRELVGDTARIDDVALSVDGSLVATLQGDGGQIWDVATGRSFYRFDAPGVQSVTFARDGATVLTTGSEATLRWTVPELPDDALFIQAWVDVHAMARWNDNGPPNPVGAQARMDALQLLEAFDWQPSLRPDISKVGTVERD